MRRAVLLAPALLVLAACGGEEGADAARPSSSAPPATSTAEESSTSPAAPTPADDLAADQALTRTLYYDLTQAYNDGLQSAADFIAARNHPATPYTAEECGDFLRSMGWTDDLRSTSVPDVQVMALDPGWTMPDGRYEGQALAGRIYILPVTATIADSATGAQNPAQTAQVHVAVVDGSAYFFQPCENLG